MTSIALLGETFTLVEAGVAVAVVVAGGYLVLSIAIGWLKRVLLRVAVKHLALAALAAMGIGLGAFAPEWLVALLGGVADLVGTLIAGATA